MSTGRLAEGIRFPAEVPDGPLDVREVRAYLREIAGADHPRLDDIDLITAEIATNAVRHTASGIDGGGLWVAVAWHGRWLCASFTDDGGAAAGPQWPEDRPDEAVEVDGEAESGRGLMLVAALADRWGFHREESGVFTVWFEVGADDKQ